MRLDNTEVESNFRSIYKDLELIALKIEENLFEILKEYKNLDKVSCRVKSVDSFMVKANKVIDGELKYKHPLREIQDMIGARIVIFYKSDVDIIREKIKDYYKTVEQVNRIPDDVSKFGYEGFHMVCSIPSPFRESYKENALIPNFFELQIKTLYQHAWSQAGHGLGYKPESPLTDDEVRKLAFIAAQSWGADTILEELAKTRLF